MESLQLVKNTTNTYHCPFNVAHTMPQKTVGMHLGKCPDRPANYVHCSLNFLHVIPSSERMEHEKNCPNRTILDHILYESEDVVRPNIDVQEARVCYNDDESWNDVQHTSQPSVVHRSINQRPNLMKPKYGLTKSERKQHRFKITNEFQNVDLSFNETNSINKRQDASTIGVNIKQGDGKKDFFIGQRPPQK